ncbi:unnamed protein product, partial [Brassica napus]
TDTTEFLLGVGVGLYKNGMVLLNLRTCKFNLHKEEDQERVYGRLHYEIWPLQGVHGLHILPAEVSHDSYFSQYVLPRWLSPLT